MTLAVMLIVNQTLVSL